MFTPSYYYMPTNANITPGDPKYYIMSIVGNGTNFAYASGLAL